MKDDKEIVIAVAITYVCIFLLMILIGVSL